VAWVEAEMPAVAIHQLMRQAVEAGTTDGKTHAMFTFRMEPEHLQQMSRNVADETWKRAQRRLPEVHKTWTGRMPQFLELYRASLISAYLQQTMLPVRPVEKERYAKGRTAHAERRRLARAQGMRYVEL
jgi:hypothetical protein